MAHERRGRRVVVTEERDRRQAQRARSVLTTYCPHPPIGLLTDKALSAKAEHCNFHKSDQKTHVLTKSLYIKTWFVCLNKFECLKTVETFQAPKHDS